MPAAGQPPDVPAIAFCQVMVASCTASQGLPKRRGLRQIAVAKMSTRFGDLGPAVPIRPGAQRPAPAITADQAEELAPDMELTLLVADGYPNFSICDIPYYLCGEFTDWRRLAHRTATDLRGRTGRR